MGYRVWHHKFNIFFSFALATIDCEYFKNHFLWIIVTIDIDFDAEQLLLNAHCFNQSNIVIVSPIVSDSPMKWKHDLNDERYYNTTLRGIESMK